MSAEPESATKPRSYALPSANDGVCEILLDIEAPKSKNVTMTLGNKEGEHVTLTYDVAANTLSFDRRESGITDFSQDFPAVTTTPVFGQNGHLELRLFYLTVQALKFSPTVVAES